ncbi:hypothetical protein [Corynebacterium lipophiloflavum]|uniref:hypothetical protein n=1 Tax=Corynebacterium lipophiloflavum TaxID=161889 RepID=UPI00058E0468|nr:hypothetical protein [Corynebacterium lipophiloflavum]
MVVNATMWAPPYFLIHAGKSTLTSAMPPATETVATMNNEISGANGRSARPPAVTTAAASSVGVNPTRRASGTALSPKMQNNAPGIAVITPPTEAGAP